MIPEKTLKNNIEYYEEQIKNAEVGEIQEMFRSYRLHCGFVDIDEFIKELEDAKRVAQNNHDNVEIYSDEYTVTLIGRPPHSEDFITKFIDERLSLIAECKQELKAYEDDRYNQYLQLKKEFEDD